MKCTFCKTREAQYQSDLDNDALCDECKDEFLESWFENNFSEITEDDEE